MIPFLTRLLGLSFCLLRPFGLPTSLRSYLLRLARRRSQVCPPPSSRLRSLFRHSCVKFHHVVPTSYGRSCFHCSPRCGLSSHLGICGRPPSFLFRGLSLGRSKGESTSPFFFWHSQLWSGFYASPTSISQDHRNSFAFYSLAPHVQ